MIIFHEGLGGSGKSYEAVVKHVIPALSSGRHVWSNINGLREGALKIAEIIGKPFDDVLAMIHAFEDEDVRRLHEIIPKDVLVVIDEIQDFYPSDLRSITQEERKFVTRQRHEGLDIILMGQNFGDVNKLWKNRTQRKLIFTKRTAIGQPNKYTWTAFEGKSKEDGIEFIKINSGSGEYDKKYFGTYKSHTDETENKSLQYEDKRANIFSSKALIFGIPFAIFVGIFAINFLISFLTDPQMIVNTKKTNIKPQLVAQQQPVAQKVAIVDKKPVTAKKVFIPIDYLDDIANQYKLRLSGIIYDASGRLSVAVIDALDSSFHLKERFSLDDIRALGWNINQKVYGLDITKNDRLYVVRPFPRDDLTGRTNQQQANYL